MTNILVGGLKRPNWISRFFWLCLLGFYLSLRASANAQQSVTLGWDPDADPTVAGYMLYYGTASQQYTYQVDVGTNVTVTISSLALGSNYFFAVTSYYGNGVESPPSPEVSVSTAPARFFAKQTAVQNMNVVVPGSTNTTTDFLQFSDGIPFGYYTLVAYPWFYHHDLGYEYLFDASDGFGIFLYDLNSNSFWYTSPAIFPIMYDFTLDNWLYYYPDKNNAGHYTSGPRYFYNYSTKKIISK